MSFHRPILRLKHDSDKRVNNDIGSLPDLIHFNNVNNPNHLFGVQQVRKDSQHQGFQSITVRQLARGIEGCVEWLKGRVSGALAEDGSHQSLEHLGPVAVFLESDMTLFIYFCALLQMDIPVLLLSARLGPSAIAHLVSETGARTILVSNRTRENAACAITELSGGGKVPQLIMVEPYMKFLIDRQNGKISSGWSRLRESDTPGAVILHSSGTTGLPKPIRLSHRYLIGYAACHRLSPEETGDRLNLSTLPLYHGFGLLAPCLSLSTGTACCFPASSIIPSASSTVDLIVRSEARSLMTVPTILEEVVSNSPESDIEQLAKLDFIAVGGGAIKPMVGEVLANKGVKLLNHYGATEIGAIAPIFVPDGNYDWKYLRLRTDMDLDLRPTEPDNRDCNTWKLIGYPFGWGRAFEIQDLLQRNPNAPSNETEVKILGRNDDVIVLSTGEKVLPQLFERTLGAHESIKTAVVFGEHREEIGILLEPSSPIDADKRKDLIDSIWPLVSDLNKQVDRHARVPSSRAIIVKPNEKSIARSDKGSVMRNEVIRTFQSEIDDMYNDLKTASESKTANYLNPMQVVPGLKDLLASCLNDKNLANHISVDDDFFEGGMDSLEATRLARQLNSLANKSSFPGLSATNVRPDFIYCNPTLTKLASAITGMTDGAQTPSQADRGVEMTTMVSRSVEQLNSHQLSKKSPDIVVLLTGSTGNLGVNLLDQFCQTGHIKKVICLNRRTSQRANDGERSTTHVDAVSRQQKELENKKESGLSSAAWQKIEVLDADMQAEFFGLESREKYMKLADEVTHIVHNAWPMDFKRRLSSFESQIQSLMNIIDFSFEIHRRRCGLRPQLLFTSSIAVAGCSPSSTLSEQTINDPLWTATIGYAEAKWVCENILGEVANTYSSSIEPVILRVGQLCGSTESGYWSHREHFPTLVSASAEVGSLPDLHGTYSWLPVDVAAKTITEIMLSRDKTSTVYHVENPVRQSWEDLISTMGEKLDLSSPMSLDDWISHVASRTDKITNLQEFFVHEFKKLSSGGLVMATDKAQELSDSLLSCGKISESLLDKYICSWRNQRALP